MSHLVPSDDTPDAISELRRLMLEVREMVVQIRHDQGDVRAGARAGSILIRNEQLIPLEDAVGLVWGKSVAADPMSRRAHTSILELFATKGLNGVVLETTVRSEKWHTSREAVERFTQLAFGRQPAATPRGRSTRRTKSD